MHHALMLAVLALGLHDIDDHGDPSLLQQWVFDDQSADNGTLRSQRGDLRGRLRGRASSGRSGGLVIDGMDGMLEIGELTPHLREHLPESAMTIGAWVLISSPTEWGGIAGVIQDNGDHEEGWLLGYRGEHFCMALAATGADADRGDLTYLTAPDPFKLNTWYHVAGTFDGMAMRLWVDGNLVAESLEQSGDIRYPSTGRLAIGAYLDDNEYHPLDGAIQHVRLRNKALDGKQIREEMAAYPDMRGAATPHRPLHMLVGPYLQATEDDGVTVMWETTRPSTGRVEFGTTSELGEVAASTTQATLHEVSLRGLPPESNWFYRVVGESDSDRVESPILTFQTKIRPDTPVGFIVVSDTQNNPAVTTMMSQHAWSHRPHFIMHCGDLVGTGTVKREWVQEFFGSTGELLGRYPIYPTLGNHERDARLYYDYFSLPGEEYFYDYRWGDVHVFVLDTNKDVSPDSAQYRWFQKAIADSDARWKLVQHHQPAWTSDSNDYGDTFSGGST
ncbi:MAG: metallophosphoesterase, partial [Phycisphaerales bacterium]|nr:metallophosphoesterase [Phycisphaerales bacterium]